MQSFLDKAELKKIENFIIKEHSASMTSQKYRQDLLYFLVNNCDTGKYVCEVGPYKGGLTAQLAYACKVLNKKLIICEAVQEYADIVEENLKKLGYDDVATIYVMPFVDFVSQNKLPEKTILTIIDANHIFQYALQNFQSFHSVKSHSYAVAFHYFGLRDTDNIMGVERAVRETFPHDSIYYIGDNTLFTPCELHTEPAEDKTFFRGSEGALIIPTADCKSTWGKSALSVAKNVRSSFASAKKHIKHSVKIVLGRGGSKVKAPLNISNDEDAVVLTHGTYGKFFTLKHDIGVGKAIREIGEWGGEHVELFRKIVKKGNTVFDIGANIGHHSVCLSKLTGTSGKIFAFEPQLPVYHVLCANAMMNDCNNIFPVRAVVGELPGVVSLPHLSYEQDENFGAMCIENKEVGKENSICKLTIDDFVADPLNSISTVNLIKIDVQTFELFVLQGAIETLKKYKPVLFIEISPYWMKKINGYDYREIYSFLKELGYVFFTPQLEAQHDVPDFPLDESSMSVEWDILAVHNSSALMSTF